MSDNERQLEIDINGWHGVFIGEECFAIFTYQEHALEWRRAKRGEERMAVLEIRRVDKKFDTGPEQS